MKTSKIFLLWCVTNKVYRISVFFMLSQSHICLIPKSFYLNDNGPQYSLMTLVPLSYSFGNPSFPVMIRKMHISFGISPHDTSPVSDWLMVQLFSQILKVKVDSYLICDSTPA